MAGVYAIKCVPTGELYIGGTQTSFAKRFERHRDAFRRKRNCRLLQERYDEYGSGAFQFIPIKEFPAHEVGDREKEAIQRLQPALNIVHTNKPIKAHVQLEGGSAVRKYGLAASTVYTRMLAGQEVNLPRYAPELRKRKLHEFRGEMRSLKEICVLTAQPYDTVYDRVVKRRHTDTHMVAGWWSTLSATARK